MILAPSACVRYIPSRVYNIEERGWFSVSLLVEKDRLLEAVDHLRDCGAVDVAASQLGYLFDNHSHSYEALFGSLGI